MAVTQESRYRMHQRLEEVLGDEPATTLMEHLPPTGWANMATKQDVVHATELLSQRIDAVGEHLTGRMDSLDVRLTVRMDALDERLTVRMDALDERLTVRMDALDERLTGKIDALDERLTGTIKSLEERLTGKIEAQGLAFMTALSVEANSLRAEIHKSRGDMFKFMIVQVVAFYAANVALVGAVATLVKG